MGGFEDRLRHAVKAKGLNLSSFLREIRGREVTGANRQSLYRYIGGTRPPQDWLEAASEILGVSEPWLVYGDHLPVAGGLRVWLDGRPLAIATMETDHRDGMTNVWLVTRAE